MKVALYARVSTVDKGQDPELQLKPMRDYCKRMQWEFEEFVDYGSGFYGGKRPEFNKMLDRLKMKEFDTLMVWKLDRLSRSISQLIDVVYNELHPRNIDFICLTQSMDTTTPTGKLIFGVLSSLAEFEHDLISERVKEGIALAKTKGVTVGRKRAIDKDSLKGKAIIKRLLNAYSISQSIRGAAREVGLNPGIAFRALKEEGVLKSNET